MSIVNQMNWDAVQLDVRSAYLYGELNEPIYMEQPQGLHDGTKRFVLSKNQFTVCVKHPDVGIGGLLHISPAWDSNAWKVIHAYTNAYLIGSKTTCILLYVDDLIITGDKSEIKRVKEELFREFDMKDMGDLKFFLGIAIERDRSNSIMKLHQRNYIARRHHT